MIRVGEDGEWPLLLDVFLEHEVGAIANASREGTARSIEGPYCVSGVRELGPSGTLPAREGEQVGRCGSSAGSAP